MLRNTVITLDPVAGSFVGSGTLELGAGVTAAVELGAGLGLSVTVALILGALVIPLEAGVTGGLRLVLHATGTGGVREKLRLGYEHGGPFYENDVRLAVGALLGAELSGAVEVSVADAILCEHEWPIQGWEHSAGWEFQLPLSLGYRDGAMKASAGPLTDSPISFADVGVEVARARTLHRCDTLEEIIDSLCAIRLLPSDLCTPPSTSGGAPPTPTPPAHGPSSSGVSPASAGGTPAKTPAKTPKTPAKTPPAPSSTAPTGRTKNDPIPIVWFKPKEDNFYPKTIALDDQPFERDAPLPRLYDGKFIGVQSELWPEIDKIMQIQHVTEDEKKRPECRRFNDFMSSHGFDMRDPVKYDCDHVQDMLYSGPSDDTGDQDFEYLWPMESTANQNAGTKNINQRVTWAGVPGGPTRNNERLGAGIKDPDPEFNLLSRYVQIKSIQSPT
jgi:hypothetical protein